MSSHQVIEFARGPAAEGEALKIRRPLQRVHGVFWTFSSEVNFQPQKRVPWPYLQPPAPSILINLTSKSSIWNHAFCPHRFTNNVVFAKKSADTFFIFRNSTDTECMVCNMHHLRPCILCPQNTNFSCLETDTIPVSEVREVSLCNSAKNGSKMNFKPHF